MKNERKQRTWGMRFLAVLLSLTMVMTMSGFQALAEETMTESYTEAAAAESEAAAKAAVESEAAAKAAAESEAAAKAAAESEEAAKAAAESEAAAKAAAESEAEAKAAAESEAVKAAAESEAAAKAAAESEAAAKAAAESEAAAKAAAESEAAAKQSEAESQAQPEKDTEIEAATEYQTSGETDTEGQTEAGTETSTETQTEVSGEATTETDTEEVTEAVTETATETETEIETEEVVLETSVKQEVFEEEDGSLAVKYTLEVKNTTPEVRAENVSVKAVLGMNLEYYQKNSQTIGLNYIENIENIPSGLNLDELRIYSEKQIVDYKSAVIWINENISGGETLQYVFFAHIQDTAEDVSDIPSLFFVNGEKIDDRNIFRNGTELIKKNTQTEYVFEDNEKTVTAILSSPDALPKGAELTVTRTELTEEEIKQAEERIGEEKEIVNYYAYDMHFEKDGVEVEPEGATITVSVEYKKKKKLDTENVNIDALGVQVLHINEETGIEDVTVEAETDKKGNLSSAEFVTESFSKIILTQVVDIDRTFVYEDDKIKITAVADEEEEILNSNLVEMQIEIIEDRDSAKYKKIDAALKKQYEGTSTKVLGFSYYDFTFLKNGEEVEPTKDVKVIIKHKKPKLPENVSENLTNDKAIYHIKDEGKNIVAEQLDSSITENSKGTIKESSFIMDSFSGSAEAYLFEGNQMSREQIVSEIGIASNFAVFAIDFTNNNDMEGSIAVKNLNGSPHNMGNTGTVYTNATKFSVIISKTVSGTTESEKTFRFGFYTKSGDEYIQVKNIPNSDAQGFFRLDTVNGKGTITVTSDTFTSNTVYYVFEIDDNDQPVTTGEGTIDNVDYKVSYSINGIDNSNTVGSVYNASYIEYFKNQKNDNGVEVFRSDNNIAPSVVIGKTNKVLDGSDPSKKYIIGEDGSRYLFNSNTVITKVEGDFPIDFEQQMSNFSSLSETLAGITDSETVKVAYVPITSDGNIDYSKVFVDGTYPFSKDSNAWNNNGFTTDGKLLVINVDCTNAGGKVYFKGAKIDGKAPDNWDPVANRVILNFYQGTDGHYSAYQGEIEYRGGLGTILAPKAKVSCTVSTNGSVIAHTVDHPSCEIHHINLTHYNDAIKRTVSCGNVAVGPEKASIQLKAVKSLTGRNLEAEQFTFKAVEIDETGKPVVNGFLEEVKNDANGAVIFPAIQYTGAGTYYYQITEVNEGKAGYQYDGSVYTVAVTVTSDQKDALAATVTSVFKDGTELEDDQTVAFRNQYTANGEISLKAFKTMETDDVQLGTFQFELKDQKTGEVLETVANDETGTIAFSKIVYTEQDAGKSFVYTVSEVVPNQADQYIYDKTVYTVRVTVEDHGDGTLEVTAQVDDEDYTDQSMKFVNGTTRVNISKIDAATEYLLADAVLRVVDEDGQTVDEWKTDGTVHEIVGKLAAGGTYQLIEVSAPEGYEIAEPITFTVKEDGTADPVVMKDAMKASEKASIQVTKKLTYNGELIHAVDQTFYVALFADAEGTKRISDVKPLVFKNASASTVEFIGLDVGRTYYIGETDAAGAVIYTGELADGTLYAANFAEGNSAVIEEEDATKTILFENEFFKIPEGFYKEGELTITKKLLGADGSPINSDEVFYAGIFADAAYTVLSDAVDANIVALELNGGSQASATVKIAIPAGGEQTVYVTEVDADGNPVAGSEDFGYAVTVSKTEVTLDEQNNSADVTITNQKEETETETVIETETEIETETVIETETEKVTEKPKTLSVKTGDDTPILLYAVGAGAALLVILLLLAFGRKKKKANR